MQTVVSTQEQAIAQGQDTDQSFVVYYDPELGGYGMYTADDLDGPGSWVRDEWIVYRETH